MIILDIRCEQEMLVLAWSALALALVWILLNASCSFMGGDGVGLVCSTMFPMCGVGGRVGFILDIKDKVDQSSGGAVKMGLHNKLVCGI